MNCSCSTTKIFCIIFQLLTSNISNPELWVFRAQINSRLFRQFSFKSQNAKLSRHINLSIGINSCARKRLVLFNSQPSARLTHCLGSIRTYPNMLPLPCNLRFFWDNFEIRRFWYCFYNCLILIDFKLRWLLYICIVYIVYTFVLYSWVGCKKCKNTKRSG